MPDSPVCTFWPPGYAPGTIAVNATWMKRGFNACQMSQQLLIGIIYRSPNSSQENDKESYKLFQYIQLNYNVPKLMVGDFNYSNI